MRNIRQYNSIESMPITVGNQYSKAGVESYIIPLNIQLNTNTHKFTSGPAKYTGTARRKAVFLFFISVFYKNIFSIWKFTEIYLGRPTAGRQGLTCKKKTKTNCRQVPGTGRPAAGRAALFFAI